MDKKYVYPENKLPNVRSLTNICLRFIQIIVDVQLDDDGFLNQINQTFRIILEFSFFIVHFFLLFINLG